MKQGYEAYWASPRGQRMERAMDRLPPFRNLDARMVHHFHRFLDGASDETAIKGWRYVMGRRETARRELAGAKSSPRVKSGR